MNKNDNVISGDPHEAVDTAPEAEGVEIEVDVKEETAEEEACCAEEEHKEHKAKGEKKYTAPIKEALRQVETFGQGLAEALQGRGNVVMVRVNDEALDHLDMLVDAEITKSRSESAAFLINEGIKANDVLFEQISAITQQIAELREQLRHQVKLEEPEAAE